MQNQNLVVAAEAAVVNNVVANEATSVESAQAASLLDIALGDWKEYGTQQYQLFGRYIQSTKVENLLSVIDRWSAKLSEWQNNLQTLKNEIDKERSAYLLRTMIERVNDLSPEYRQALIEKLSSLQSNRRFKQVVTPAFFVYYTLIIYIGVWG